jgi:SAM-dependent methyltransferase
VSATGAPGGPRPDLSGFASVDASADPAVYGTYLDLVSDIDLVREWKARSLDLLEPRPGARLLDLGCGVGDDARALAALVAPGGAVIGVDASRAMVEEARRRAAGTPGLEFAVMDAARLDLGDAAVDGCRTERTLQHVPDPAAAIAEMARVTRPGGVVVAAEPDWGTLVVDAADPAVARRVCGGAGQRFRSPAVGRALRGLMLAAGLVEVQVIARTLVVTDRDRAELLFDLREAAGRALAPGEAAAWEGEMAGAAAAGRFLAAITSFMAAGRRAESA